MISPPPSSRRASCIQHPERPGLGVCILCKQIFCSECITKLDGINHCNSCLAHIQQAHPAAKKSPSPSSPRLLLSVLVWPLSLLFFAALCCLLFLLSLFPALLESFNF